MDYALLAQKRAYFPDLMMLKTSMSELSYAVVALQDFIFRVYNNIAIELVLTCVYRTYSPASPSPNRMMLCFGIGLLSSSLAMDLVNRLMRLLILMLSMI